MILGKRGALPYHDVETGEIVSAVRVERQTNVRLPGGGLTSVLAGDYDVTNGYGVEIPVRGVDFKKRYAPGRMEPPDVTPVRAAKEAESIGLTVSQSNRAPVQRARGSQKR